MLLKSVFYLLKRCALCHCHGLLSGWCRMWSTISILNTLLFSEFNFKTTLFFLWINNWGGVVGLENFLKGDWIMFERKKIYVYTGINGAELRCWKLCFCTAEHLQIMFKLGFICLRLCLQRKRDTRIWKNQSTKQASLLFLGEYRSVSPLNVHSSEAGSLTQQYRLP